jgi:hypothetical protein
VADSCIFLLPAVSPACVLLLLLLLLQTMLGNAASVTLGPDGMLWVLYRGGRVWDADAFDADFRYLFHDPIPTDVVVQMHPDTGGSRHPASSTAYASVVTVSAEAGHVM